jgi:hypothetical protein
VDDQLCESYLDGIFDSLAFNKTVDYLRLTFSPSISLKLGDSNSLRFIEKNTTLKTLDFKSLKFKDEEMKILNESLIKNDSISELDLSSSNFKGPFGFLQKKNLKVFSFLRIWKTLKKDHFQDFIFNLQCNRSLMDLDLSIGHFSMTYLTEIISVLSEHKSIEVIKMNKFTGINNSKKLYKLLKNPNLKELKLKGSIRLPESFEKIFQELNENQTLTTLDISGNILNESLLTKIKNETLQKLHMTGKDFFIFNQRKQNRFLEKFKFTERFVEYPFIEGIIHSR